MAEKVVAYCISIKVLKIFESKGLFLQVIEFPSFKELT
jgi:hypothetical protein